MNNRKTLCARLVVLLVFVGQLISFSGCAGKSPAAKWIGKSAPPARFFLLDGQVVSLRDFRGKPGAVLFWALSCSASRSVVEDFTKLAQKHSGKEGAVFLAASLDAYDDFGKLKAQIGTRKLHGALHALSGNEQYDEAKLAFGIEEIPTIIVFDRNGKVVAVDHSASVVEKTLLKQ